MEYVRLTPKGVVEMLNTNDHDYGSLFGTFVRYATRLHELEDKIEKGLLVDKYFVAKTTSVFDGTTWYCVGYHDDSTYMVESQHATEEEAKARLKELQSRE